MIWSDQRIFQSIINDELKIDPFDPSNVEPASIDLRLGDEFYEPSTDTTHIADSYTFPAQSFNLATTLETVELPRDVAGIMKGRSTLGRMGILPVTAGFADPGFPGQLTLEMVNVSDSPVELEAGTRVCQIVLMETTAVEKDYVEKGGQYADQEGATKPGEL